MRIGFDVGHLCERGTSVAVYDYAHFGREMLGFEPVIFFDASRETNALAHARFKQQFELIPYNGDAGLPASEAGAKLDAFYFIKSGYFDGKVARASKTLIHCVFQYFQPHGDVYAYVSQWLSNTMTSGAAPVVPHIVWLPTPNADLRARLGIPRDAFVIGRHGGYAQFDIDFAKSAVVTALARRKDLYFLFLNTEPFCKHERALFLPAIVDPVEKANFIAACDAGLHARSGGESFGLAIAEFLFFDKPVIAWAGGQDRNHLTMLAGAAGRYLYPTHTELLRILCDMERAPPDGTGRNAVAAFSPPQVIAAFDTVFLKGPPAGALQAESRNAPCPCGSGKRYKHCHGAFAGPG